MFSLCLLKHLILSVQGKLAVMTSPDNAWASLTSPDMMLRMVNMTSQVSISKKNQCRQYVLIEIHGDCIIYNN